MIDDDERGRHTSSNEKYKKKNKYSDATRKD
jgi:hypothetical protein